MPLSESELAYRERKRRRQAGWSRFRYMPCLPSGTDGRRLTACEDHLQLSRRAAASGMVLLKNEGHTLPFDAGTRLAVFGKAQADYVRGGGGSGEVTTSYTRSLLDGLRIKEAEGKLHLFPALGEFYTQDVQRQYREGALPGQTEEPAIPEKLLCEAKTFTDTALITICRFSGEGWDRSGIPGDGDFYLSPQEQAMVDLITANFSSVSVVLNVGGVIDSSWFAADSRIQSVLLGWQAGIEGGLAAADLLTGDAVPSGKLTDTFAAHCGDYPSTASFTADREYVDYTEDIYVGYRYFETIPGAAARVNYPFGFGLSYTTFAVQDPAVTIGAETISITCRVTNTGDRPGREVVQAYYGAPQGKLGKPARVLAAFAKTKELAPGESQSLTLSFAVRDMASYDDLGKVASAAYVLEPGRYTFYLGTDVRSAAPLPADMTIPEAVVTEQLTNRLVPVSLQKRLTADGSYESLLTAEPTRCDIRPENGDLVPRYAFPVPGQDPESAAYLSDVVEGRMTLEAFVGRLPDRQLIELLGGRPNRGVANTYGFGDLDEYGIPAIMTADGPAGLRIEPQCGVTTTAWPCATLLACTWDPDLVAEVGAAAARELKENGIGVWLAPAMNIHRSPLCGRNFEYYSEDPLVSGKIGAAMCRGIQSEKIAACVKHFCCNNKEVGRKESDSRVSERALREIYLRQFEIAVKEAQPWTLMTSYNMVNGSYPSTNPELLQGILRDEWGYEGLVMTDWWNRADQALEIRAGNDVKMPVGYPEDMEAALADGTITREDLRRNVTRLLELFLKLL